MTSARPDASDFIYKKNSYRQTSDSGVHTLPEVPQSPSAASAGIRNFSDTMGKMNPASTAEQHLPKVEVSPSGSETKSTTANTTFAPHQQRAGDITESNKLSNQPQAGSDGRQVGTSSVPRQDASSVTQNPTSKKSEITSGSGSSPETNKPATQPQSTEPGRTTTQPQLEVTKNNNASAASAPFAPTEVKPLVTRTTPAPSTTSETTHQTTDKSPAAENRSIATPAFIDAQRNAQVTSKSSDQPATHATEKPLTTSEKTTTTDKQLDKPSTLPATTLQGSITNAPASETIKSAATKSDTTLPKSIARTEDNLPAQTKFSAKREASAATTETTSSTRDQATKPNAATSVVSEATRATTDTKSTHATTDGANTGGTKSVDQTTRTTNNATTHGADHSVQTGGGSSHSTSIETGSHDGGHTSKSTKLDGSADHTNSSTRTEAALQPNAEATHTPKDLNVKLHTDITTSNAETTIKSEINATTHATTPVDSPATPSSSIGGAHGDTGVSHTSNDTTTDSAATRDSLHTATTHATILNFAPTTSPALDRALDRLLTRIDRAEFSLHTTRMDDPKTRQSLAVLITELESNRFPYHRFRNPDLVIRAATKLGPDSLRELRTLLTSTKESSFYSNLSPTQTREYRRFLEIVFANIEQPKKPQSRFDALKNLLAIVSDRDLHIVKFGQTLRWVALKVLNDAALWPLVAKINGFLKSNSTQAKPTDTQLSAQPKPGTRIMLPTPEEIMAYRAEQKATTEATTPVARHATTDATTPSSTDTTSTRPMNDGDHSTARTLAPRITAALRDTLAGLGFKKCTKCGVIHSLASACNVEDVKTTQALDRAPQRALITNLKAEEHQAPSEIYVLPPDAFIAPTQRDLATRAR